MASSRNNARHIGAHEKYKGVYECVNTKTGVVFYRAHMNNPKTGSSTVKEYDTDIKAAKAVDMFRINLGLEPVNILKRK